MYQPASRVLTVLELLQSRPGISGTEIARRLEVDRRTVRRYITTLQDLGVPVRGVRGRHGGYRLQPGFRLPPLMLTDDEALAVSLGSSAGSSGYRSILIRRTAPAPNSRESRRSRLASSHGQSRRSSGWPFQPLPKRGSTVP
ncbi:MAG: HTH domain-containing protein [Thermomicrobiales bacterium]